MSNKPSHLTITVEKSHILSLGERLYEQSIELIRELANNAYDADATRVDVTTSSAITQPGIVSIRRCPFCGKRRARRR